MVVDVSFLTPGFDGNYGWITVNEADVIFHPATWDELEFEKMNEVVAKDGTIFVLLRKRN
ncbi:MAG: hypothetical protein V7K14_03720 [Nostoc sp.]|uniref:hypothetical protein n=1 Tax=Nostoc sp. TaxID=1180 RepID=UPI002FF99BDD